MLSLAVCFSAGASPVSLVCAGMMPFAVVLAHYLLKECAFVTDRAGLQKSYLVG